MNKLENFWIHDSTNSIIILGFMLQYHESSLDVKWMKQAWDQQIFFLRLMAYVVFLSV